MTLTKWEQLGTVKGKILLHESEMPSSFAYSFYTMYSGITHHFKEVDMICLAGGTNTLSKKFTTGLSLKFKVMYQVVNTRLTHCLQ